MNALKNVMLNYCVCAFFASVLHMLVPKKEEKIFRALSFCVISAVSLMPLLNADFSKASLSFDEVYGESYKSEYSAARALESAVGKNVSDTLIKLGIDEYEIYVSTNTDEEKSIVRVTEVRVELAPEFENRTDDVKNELDAIYKDVLKVEVKNGASEN